MVSLKIDSAMVYRSALGAGLKSIGGLIYRVNDIPENQKTLRRQVFMREALVVGAIFVASIVLEGAFANFMPRLKRNLSEGAIQLVQFVPQALAYALAESGSRQVFPVKESFEKALDDQPTLPSKNQTVLKENSMPLLPARYESLAVSSGAVRSNPFTQAPHPMESVRDYISEEASRMALFRAQSRYPNPWETKRQPMTMRGFY